MWGVHVKRGIGDAVLRRIENPAQLRHQLFAILATLLPILKGDTRRRQRGLGDLLGLGRGISGLPLIEDRFERMLCLFGAQLAVGPA